MTYRPRLQALALLVSLCAVPAFGQASKTDKAGCTDPAMIPSRMPGFRLANCTTREFDSFQFRNSKPGQKGPKLEGKLLEWFYELEDKSKASSPLAAVRNYENAIRKVGGTIVDIQPEAFVIGKVVKDGIETWVQVLPYFQTRITVSILQLQSMEQHVVADAASFGNALKDTGHAAVYGIYFDSGKAIVKPESEPALKEVAKLLASDPSLKLWVIGHTDSQGSPEQNLNLSRERAAAVASALVAKHGVAAARLKSEGCGPFAPVASNETEEGRAKNRRVELLKQ